MESYIGERVARLETIAEDHKDEINRLKDDNKILHELVANNKSLTDLVKDSHEVHKETRITLREINTNITELNFGQKQMQEEMSMIKDEMTTANSRISEVEKKTEEVKGRGKFDILDFLSNDIPKFIGIALITSLLIYLGWIK